MPDGGGRGRAGEPERPVLWDPTPELEIPGQICETSQVALTQMCAETLLLTEDAEGPDSKRDPIP